MNYPVPRATVLAANEDAQNDFNLAVFYFFLLAARNAAPSQEVFEDTVSRLHEGEGRWRIALPAHGSGAAAPGPYQSPTPADRADNTFFDFEAFDLTLSPQGQQLRNDWVGEFMQGSAGVNDIAQESSSRPENSKRPSTPRATSTAHPNRTPNHLSFQRSRDYTVESPISTFTWFHTISPSQQAPPRVPATDSNDPPENDNVLRARDVQAEASTPPVQRTTPQRPVVSPITPSPDTTTEGG